MWKGKVEGQEGNYPALGSLRRCKWRKDEEPLKRFRLFDFHGLSCLTSLAAWTSSAVSWCLPMQPSLWPAQQPSLVHHCAQCSQWALAVDGFWVADWEPDVYCNAKDTFTAKPKQRGTIGPCPYFHLWSLSSIHCVPPLPAWYHLRSAEHLPEVFREVFLKPSYQCLGSHLRAQWAVPSLLVLCRWTNTQLGSK